MGSGSEDEDEDSSSVGHQVHGNVGSSHLGPQSLGSGGPGEQGVVHPGDLPIGSDSCKQEDSEDQGSHLFFSFAIARRESKQLGLTNYPRGRKTRG